MDNWRAKTLDFDTRDQGLGLMVKLMACLLHISHFSHIFQSPVSLFLINRAVNTGRTRANAKTLRERLWFSLNTEKVQMSHRV